MPALPSDQRVPFSAALSVVVGSMIGTGVFCSLGYQLATLPSGFPVLLLWVLGGVLAAFGAVNYAELAALFPRSGGEYRLLGQVYHPSVGFISGWVSLTVGFPAPVAIAASWFGTYAAGALKIPPETSPHLPTLLGCGAVLLVTAGQLISVAATGRLQTIMTVLKIALTAGLAGCAFVLATPSGTSLLPRPGDHALILSASFPVSLVYVMYAYSGWNAACYISGEVRDPQRNVPRALWLGATLVTILYVALNAAFLYSSPMSELAGREQVAAVAAGYIFGEAGARLVAALIAVGLLSMISAMIWSGSRVAEAMGEDSALLAPLARTTSRGIPWLAVLVQTLLALAMLLRWKAEEIVVCTGFTLELILLLTVWGVVHLRVRQPGLVRPCRAWLYPWSTLVFLICVAFHLGTLLLYHPGESVAGLGIVALGGILYALARPQVTSGK